LLQKTQPNPNSITPQKAPLNGIWQIIDLVIDKAVTGRRIVDSSLSSANNSLLSFIRKICQEPFVEFFTDTYQDRFTLVVRKPPTDKVGIQTLLNGPIVSEDGSTLYRTTIVDIEMDDVVKESLSWDDKEVYSWYSFTQQNTNPSGGGLSTAYIPAIYFEEYAKIWGSRPLQVAHNYSPYISHNDLKSSTDASKFQTQAVYDLKYLIESNAYKPFTRKGTIVVNGDRRLKRGNLVRLKATGEIFMIDSVSQSYSISENSIDRTTTLQVSRGMVESFIDGVDVLLTKKVGGKDVVREVKVGYFEIVNTNVKFEKRTFFDPVTKKEVVDIDVEKIYESMKVDQEVFNFFLKKQQFDPKYR